MMSLYTKQINHLSESCVYFLLRHINSLCSAESESTNSSNFVNWRYGKNFVYEGSFLEFGEKSGNILGLVLHLESIFLLQIELFFVFVELRPKLAFFLFDRLFVPLETFNSLFLFYFLLFQVFKFIFKRLKLILEFFSLLNGLWVLIFSTEIHFARQVSLYGDKLLAKCYSFLLFRCNLFVNWGEYFVKAVKTDGIFYLQTLRCIPVSLDNVLDQKIAVDSSSPSKNVQMVILYLSIFSDARFFLSFL